MQPDFIIRRFFLFIFISSTLNCLYSCNQSKSKENIIAPVDKRAKRVLLQPFSDFTKEETIKISNQLKNLGLETEVADPIKHPSFAWRPERARYRADSLIRFLSGRTTEGEVAIGLTHYDVSTTKDGKEDWGVMGLGFRPGKACVISTFRIKGKNREEKFAKVIVHEFGHTRGLDHCPVKDCLMRDAEGKDHLDEETGFCKTCAGYLAKAGYRIY
jgi:archaemetzincin